MNNELPLVNTGALIEEALAKKLDPHTYVAAKLLGCEMADVTPAERNIVKRLNYVHLYSSKGPIFHGKTS